MNLEPFNFEGYKNGVKENKTGDSLVYSSGNSQINNQNNGMLPNNMLETKGVHGNIFM